MMEQLALQAFILFPHPLNLIVAGPGSGIAVVLPDSEESIWAGINKKALAAFTVQLFPQM